MTKAKELVTTPYRSMNAEVRTAMAAFCQFMLVLGAGIRTEFGLFDRSSQSFVNYYRHNASGCCQSVHSPPIEKQSLPGLLGRLKLADQRFVKETLDEMSDFLIRQEETGRDHFRLSLDLCLPGETTHCERVLVHLRYFDGGTEFPGGLVLYQRYSLSTEHPYRLPMRTVCRWPSLQPVLYKSGEGRMPRFSEKKQRVLRALSQGFGLKEIADRYNCSLPTINNMLADCRAQLQLSNNTQLVYYAQCFGCI